MMDVMIDFETLGTGHDAVVVQIGACYFDRHSGAIYSTFKENIDPKSSVKLGLTIDASTICWWMDQDKDTFNSVFKADDKKDVREVFIKFNNFLAHADTIWSHATFDFVKLEYHLNKLGIEPSFHYRCPRDIRTLLDIAELNSKDFKQVGISHDALADALFQVIYTVDALKRVSLIKGKDNVKTNTEV